FFLCSLLFAALAICAPADASVSIAVSFDALLHDSTSASVATPTDARAVWEDGRIVTFTHVHVDRAIAGDLKTGDETWVASLGGIVGTVGQVVDGEPQLHVGVPYLLFLKPDASATPGTRIVTARAQGQFHLRAASSTSGSAVVNVIRNPGAGEILAPRPAPGALTNGSTVKTAVDAIADRAIDDVAKDVAASWSKAHAVP
ncbi:MAG: hypothetical protein ACRELY_29555, partial [Polyangiaceae bacterium]